MFSTILTVIGAVPMLVMALCMPMILRKVDKFVLYFWSLVANAVIGFVIYFIGYANPMVYICSAYHTGISFHNFRDSFLYVYTGLRGVRRV